MQTQEKDKRFAEFNAQIQRAQGGGWARKTHRAADMLQD